MKPLKTNRVEFSRASGGALVGVPFGVDWGVAVVWSPTLRKSLKFRVEGRRSYTFVKSSRLVA